LTVSSTFVHKIRNSFRQSLLKLPGNREGPATLTSTRGDIAMRKLIRVDMTQGKVQIEDLAQEYSLLGGRGLT
jgi:hypothetical protein